MRLNVPAIETLAQKEVGYLVGFFIGDGYANYNKNDRHYHVEFYFNSVKEKEMEKNVSNMLRLIGLKCFKAKDKRCNSLRLRVNSKILFKFIKNKVVEFHNEKWGGKRYLLGVLSGFIDAEGYVNKGEVVVTQRDRGVLEKIKKICKVLNIETRRFWSFKNYKPPNRIWRLRISTKIKNWPHNSLKLKNRYCGAAAYHSEWETI